MQRSISTRSISNVTVSFGAFASFEAKIFAASREEGSGLNLVAKNAAGVFVKPTQSYMLEGKVVPYNDLERGYQMGDESFVVLTKAEIDSTKSPGSKQVEISKFIPLSQVDPIYFDKTYVLTPNVDKKDKSANPKSVTSYALLLAVLKKTNKVGQAKLELRGKEHNVLIRAAQTPDGDVLMLHTLFTYNEIRSVNVQRPTFDIASNDELVNTGIALIGQLAGDFVPTALESANDNAMEALIARKIAITKGEAPAEAAPDAGSGSTAVTADDIMAALKASLAAGKITVNA